ncbi:MAG TPA: GNAT family N-acetyltransferase [Croceibacterium sp.]
MSALPPGYELTDDPARIDPAAAHAYLTRSYWSPGIALETVAQAIANSLCIAVLHDGRQIAFARIISDFTTFAYLADVYVLENHRGHGIASVMLAHLKAHPRLQGLRRWLLFTKDAQPLYAKAGFAQYPDPERVMVRSDAKGFV